MAQLPAEAVLRIADRRRQAESDLKKSISIIEETDDIAPYLLAFKPFAITLFDSEAEELLSICEDSETYERNIRDEVAIRLVEGIMGDRSRQAAQENRSPEVRQRSTEQEIGSDTIWETDQVGKRTLAVEGIQAEHAKHGDWERFMPPHIGFFIRSRDNATVREELNQVLRQRAVYWVGQFPARVQARKDEPVSSEGSNSPDPRRDQTLHVATIPSGESFGMPYIKPQRHFSEARYRLVGGPIDPEGGTLLYRDFRLLAREAESVLGRNQPVHAVDNWLDRLFNESPYARPWGINEVLLASQEHLHECSVYEREIGNLDRADRLKVLAAECRDLQARFLATQEYPCEILRAIRDGFETPATISADDTPQGFDEAPKLNSRLIKQWMGDQGYENEDLATSLDVSVRTVSSLRNNGRCHGRGAVTKLANLMGLDPDRLYQS